MPNVIIDGNETRISTGEVALLPEGFVNFSFEVMKRAMAIRELKLTQDQLVSKMRVNVLDLKRDIQLELVNVIEIAAIAMVMGVADE